LKTVVSIQYLDNSIQTRGNSSIRSTSSFTVVFSIWITVFRRAAAHQPVNFFISAFLRAATRAAPNIFTFSYVSIAVSDIRW